MPKRAYGTGSLYVTDGYWYGRWRTQDGRRRCRKLGPEGRNGFGRKQAEQHLRQAMLADLAAPRADVPTLADLAPALVAELERRGRKRSHIRTVRSRLDAHMLPLLGDRTVVELVVEDIRGLIDRMRGCDASAKTIRKTVAVLGSLLRLAQDRGLCDRNPVERVALPEVRRDRTLRCLTMPELERALAAAPPQGAPKIEQDWWPVVRLLALTAAMTGLRLGELRALRWRDLDMGALRVRVHRAEGRRSAYDSQVALERAVCPARLPAHG